MPLDGQRGAVARSAFPAPIVSFVPGDRVLILGAPMLPPVTIESVRAEFCGEPETDPQVSWRHTAPGRGRVLQHSRASELAPVPDGYEPPPALLSGNGERDRLALSWLDANLSLLREVHGLEAVLSARKGLQNRIARMERIDAALTAEPDAGAMRRALIAMGVE